MLYNKDIVDKDIQFAQQIATRNYNFKELFNEYDKIYLYTNEDLELYKKYMNFIGNVLTVTASGDHQLFAILNGATNVTAFDINKLAKYFAELKFHAVRKLSYDEFLRFYSLKKQGDKVVLTSMLEKVNERLYDKVCYDMSSLFRYFWERYFEVSNQKNMQYLFSYSINPNNNIYIRDPSMYYLLQEKAESAKINYIDSNIFDLPNRLENEKFSSILFSNITSYFDYKDLLKTVKLCHKLSQYLAPDGLIQFGYGNLEDNIISNLLGGNRVDMEFVKDNSDYLFDEESFDKIITFYKPR